MNRTHRHRWLATTGGTLFLALACAGVLPAQESTNPLAGIRTEDFAPATSRMTSEFQYLVQDLKALSPDGRRAFMGKKGENRFHPLFRVKGDNSDQLETYIVLESWDEALRETIVKKGAVEVVAEDARRHIIQGYVPLDRIEALAAADGVRELRRPSYGIPASGTVLSEGDPNLGTNFIRGFANRNGFGINVGVISNGLFNELFPSTTPATLGTNSDERVGTRNLPTFPLDPGDLEPTSAFLGNVSIFPQSFALHDISGTNPLGLAVPDGAAMLEILFDVAPGARYFFHSASTDVEMVQAREVLTEFIGGGRGANVIVDDVIFYDAGRFDGTSAVSRQAQEIVLTKDIIYVTSTGDYTPPIVDPSIRGVGAISERFPLFINGYFRPDPRSRDAKIHNWAEGRSPEITDNVLILRPQNDVIDLLVVWDDVWDDNNPRAIDDIDIFLLKPVDLDPGTLPFLPEVVRASTDIQNGSGRPIERITVQLDSRFADSNFRLVMSRKDTENTAPRLFTMVIFQGIVAAEDAVYLTHGLAGNNGDARPPVITVGSIDAVQGVDNILPSTVPGVDPGPGRAFDNRFVRWFSNQSTPSVVSYSNTLTLSTTTLDSLGRRRVEPFGGSSAAAAHIGGLATLLRHSFTQIPAYLFHEILQDTRLPEGSQFPNATRLLQTELAPFGNRPTYLRVNGFDTWGNIEVALRDGTLLRSAPISTDTFVSQWRSSGAIGPFNEALIRDSNMGLELSPGGMQDVFGFWESPLLTMPDKDGVQRSELRSDRLYVLTARIGTDETDSSKVPDFRLRLLTGSNDEAALLVVSDVSDTADNAPDTIGGKEYKLYYRPSNDAVAKQGVRFSFDLIHFNPADNADATLFLHDVKFEEFPLPE